MNKTLNAALASYGRAALVAIVVAISMGKTEPRDLLTAAVIAIAAPLLRAINPNDAAFGVVADAAIVEIDKLAKADAKKKTVKKSAK
jgi:hypothetical protein